jgi:hypothetical protein
MKWRIPVIVAAVLVVAAFAAGYSVRWVDLIPRSRAGGQALAQPQPTPSPRESPRQKEQQRNRDRGTVAGTVESVRDRTLVVRVTHARGVKVDQGAALTAQVDVDAAILRASSLAELKKGSTVTLRGSLESGTFVVRQIIVDLRK